MNRTLTRRAFGLPADPWGRLELKTADSHRVHDMVSTAIEDRALVSIVGPTGMGKSRAFRAALQGRPGFDSERHLVRVRRLDRERRTIADVVTALYAHLGRPKPRGGAEERDIDLRRVLGEAVRVERGRPTVPLIVMLDDSHLLHWRTIDALKGLREHDWMGASPLLGVVLLGQSDPLAARKEIRQRADTLHLAGLTLREAELALEHAVAPALSAEAKGALAANAAGGTWNDLIESVDVALAIAQAEGHQQVERVDAIRATGAGLRDIAKAVGVSQAEIARQVGASETQVSRVLSGERQDRALQDRITALLLGSSPAKTQAAG